LIGHEPLGQAAGAIRVAIADDHPLYRDGLRASLGSLDGIVLVGEAADGRGAVELAREARPDVLLLDMEMPGGGGLGALREIRAAGLPTAVVMLTMHDEDSSVIAAMRAGARGYLSKSADRDEIARTIATCAAGGVVFGARLSDRLAGLFEDPQEPGRSAFPSLTERERDVLDRLARGEDNETIARRLGLSSKTVRNHVSVIFGKLAARDRAEAIVLAREAGLGMDPGSRSGRSQSG
jgi:DNA-binding NarL/FixJ family response regulator